MDLRFLSRPDSLRQCSFLSAQSLAQEHERHPERFVKGQPVVKPLPDAVWIYPPVIIQFPFPKGLCLHIRHECGDMRCCIVDRNYD